MKKLLLVAVCLSIAVCSFGQEKKPRLIVGIVVDQMRQEYLYRFQERFGDDGFKKLINDGFMFKNAHFNYVPTYTGPGHASVYTGTTPGVHGIISNNWYDKVSGKSIYCASDETEQTVGSTSDNGQMSPRNLLTTTITDELRLSTQMRSKTIGVSLKDRGAIFPAGHLGDAYWYDTKTGDFITSTYYTEELPAWVKKFNKRRLAEKYLSGKWETLYDIKTYTASGPDKSPYEGKVAGGHEAVFPYDLSEHKKKFGRISSTPFGNDLVKDMALATLEAEQLGKGDETDFLSVSFSSTDYVGHHFGPNSVELEDTYLRLDKNIATIIDAMDDQVGKGNYVIFLTADHAVADVPQYLMDNNVPAGYFQINLPKDVTQALNERYGESEWVENVSNFQIFLNHDVVAEKKLLLHDVQEFVAEFIMKYDGIAESYPAYAIGRMDYNTKGIKGLLARGYHQKRSGDILYSHQPGWFPSSNNTGSTHGSAFTYDTNVPMLWYGAGIKSGESVKFHPITDIAPTISAMLEMKMPNGAIGGNPLEELFED
ncbi:MAG: alkaline phosphatase PafA [Fulvivirga sp.]